METSSAYIPMDRRQALARGTTLPERTQGAALFADISGFTPLTETLTLELGPKRGAEELTHHLNEVYNALIAELHHYGGSVISFSGDAITCWLDGDDGARATACALAMQQGMQRFAEVKTASGGTVSLGMKAAVATGPVRRFLVGNPECCIIEAMAGTTLERLAAAEHLAGRGEVILDPETVASLGDKLQIVAWRDGVETRGRFAVVAGLTAPVPHTPWSPLAPDTLTGAQVSGWLLPPVYQRLESGQGEFLAELRPAVALFLRFGGIDYDQDPAATDKLDAFVRGVQGIVRRYEGSLLQLTIGDKGSYVYFAFGAPIAHEDDATRAASAALECQALAGGLDYLADVQIGIAQGRMRTGAYGSRTRRTYGVLGDAVNLSARLMQIAELGQILVSKAAQQATAEAFIWERLADIRVKGKAEPVPIFSLMGLKERHTIRLQEQEYALPMVGRKTELALIEEKLTQVLQGRGQIVGITTEAGMGKSRLVAEVHHMASEHGLVSYGGECESYGTNTSYLVWQSIWRDLFGLRSDWPTSRQVQALEGQLAAIDPALVPRLPLLGAVLNLSIPDNDLTRSFDAKLRKASLEALLVDCLRAWARQTPLLLVLENCHWIDPVSHDLLELIGRALADLPILLILAYRSLRLERLQALSVSELSHFTKVRLADFTPQEAEELIRLKFTQVFGSQAKTPQALVERVTARAQGNPFYIEELLNYLQAQVIDPYNSQAWEQLDLPSSLHSLILSRIDQLRESQKTTLKVASVIGRLFKAAMLFGVHPQRGDWQRVNSDLEALQSLDFTPLDPSEPELTYFFKHVLAQEVTYETLPYATRATLHNQIGQYIERTYGDALEQYVDLLAHHYDRSQNEAKRREYLLKAGEVAQADYANAAAINYYQRVLPLVPDREKTTVLLKLGHVLVLVGDWEDAEVRYWLALALAEELGDRQATAWCQSAIGELSRKQGEYADALEWLQRARAGFEELGDEAGVGQALHLAGTVAAQQGDWEAAGTLYEQSLAIRRKLGDEPRIASLLSSLGILARYQGDYNAACSLCEEALAIRRALGDRWAIANSLNNQGTIALDQGNYAEARSRLEEAVALLREIGDQQYYANSLNNLGNVARAQGDYTTARSLYRESLAINRELGDKWALAYLLEDMGCLATSQGQPERALRLVGAASTLREAIGAPLPPADQEKLNSMLEPACQQLSESALASVKAEGRAMTLEQAIEYALSDRSA